jgi:hypothetical protein
VDGRLRRGPRRILITDEHEAEAMAALRRKHHSRVVRFFLELVGWPVSPPTCAHGNPRSPREYGDGAEHFLDPVCGTCGARRPTDHR